MTSQIEIVDGITNLVRKNTILDYYSRKAPNTVRNVRSHIRHFEAFLDTIGVPHENMEEDPEAWSIITWGLVEAYVKWMLKQEYKISTLNLMLTTIKLMTKLAYKAHTIPFQTFSEIQLVEGFDKTEKDRIDAERVRQGIETNKGVRKAAANILTTEQANTLKINLPSPQGWRDTLMMCIFLDHALRREELWLLDISSFYEKEYVRDGIQHKNWAMKIQRPKVSKVSAHLLSPDTEYAFLNYRQYCGDRLWHGSYRNGRLSEAPMSLVSISERVRYLGYTVLGIENLSPHDLRHYAVTAAARLNDRRNLVEFGGWNSDHMLSVYVHDQEFSNDGIKLPPPVLVKGE